MELALRTFDIGYLVSEPYFQTVASKKVLDIGLDIVVLGESLLGTLALECWFWYHVFVVLLFIILLPLFSFRYRFRTLRVGALAWNLGVDSSKLFLNFFFWPAGF